ncbi:MAG: efflux RND transporter periplasmic adaptor subunit [Thermoanaerobaculia bacterium]
MDRVRLPTLLLIPILAAAWLGCGKNDETPQEASEATPGASVPAPEEAPPGVVVLTPEKLAQAGIQTTLATRREVSPQLETTGEVGYEEDRLAHVSPRISGRLVQAIAKLGDRVEAGETLALIDSVELGQARTAFLSARTREGLARQAYERERSLFDRRITSEREMLEARAALEEATAERQGAETTLRLYGLDDGAISALKPGSADASLLPVRTPIAGEVVEKHATIGELVRPEDSLFTIADLGHVWIWVDIPERQLGRVHQDDLAEVRADAFPDQPQSGRITYVSSRVDRDTRTLRARVDVVNPTGLLRPGMFARLRLTDQHDPAPGLQSPGAPSVPLAAIIRDGEASIVFVDLGGGKFERRAVRLGRQGEGWVEILEGVQEGDRVVTSGGFLLKSEASKSQLGEEE